MGPAAVPIASGALGLLGSITARNRARAGASAAMDNFNQLAGQNSQFMNQIGPGVISGLQQEATQGLDPKFVAEMISRFNIGSEHDLNNIIHHLGGALGGTLGGVVNDFGEHELEGRIRLGEGLGAENQQFKNQALEMLARLYGNAQGAQSGYAQDFLGMSNQFGQQAAANNPFMFGAQFLANNPGLFSRGPQGASPTTGFGGSDKFMSRGPSYNFATMPSPGSVLPGAGLPMYNPVAAGLASMPGYRGHS